MVKKIVAIGPESTGKSSLCTRLSNHYNVLWCPEYAREYLLKHGTRYTYAQLEEIAEGQWRLEQEYLKKAASRGDRFLFVDTDQYVMKVWCQYVFGACHKSILRRIDQQHAHAYLLCHTDLPWTRDELREYPDEKPRNELMGIYKYIMWNQPLPVIDITGMDDERFNKAVQGIDAYFGYH